MLKQEPNGSRMIYNKPIVLGQLKDMLNMNQTQSEQQHHAEGSTELVTIIKDIATGLKAFKEMMHDFLHARQMVLMHSKNVLKENSQHE